MANINVGLVTDIELATKAQMRLRDIGIDIKTAVNGFLQKLANDELSVEEIKKISKPTSKKGPRSDLKGILKGKVWMSDDFNEPMECMKDYMP